MESGIKILGISGSPHGGGNTVALLEESLEEARRGGADCELVTLHGRRMEDCRQCNWCFKKQEGELRCMQDDDLAELYRKMELADGIILASPVYFGRLSGYLAVFIDRMRPYVHGNLSRGALRNKVGAALVVSWFRGGGGETAIASIHQFFFAVNMVVATPDLGLSGTWAYSSIGGIGQRAGDDRLLVLQDQFGIAGARSTGARVVELCGMLQPPPAT
ncbi:MAG: flavodoxin family protein [Candidatus Geothermincolia bacterium]